MTRIGLNAAETALAIQVERHRVAEAVAARDVVVQHLSTACKSVEEKAIIISNLQNEKAELEIRIAQVQNRAVAAAVSDNLNWPSSTEKGTVDQVCDLQILVQQLQDEIKSLKGQRAMEKVPSDDPPTYEEGQQDDPAVVFPPISRNNTPEKAVQLARQEALRVLREAQSNNPSRNASPGISMGKVPEQLRLIVQDFNELDISVTTPQPIRAEELIKSRNAILAALPLPTDIPSDSLKPIMIPPPFSLHEFLANAAGPLKNSTNPRVATAHRWSSVDVLGRMSKPTECFYNKDGKWYYAGIYKGIRLDDLTVTEWEHLSPETAQALIKETLAGRKNTSPQNIYETTQLYSAGALKLACVGLQCIGFNNTLYRTILEQASKCTQNGRWRDPFGPAETASGALWDSGLATTDATNTITAFSTFPGSEAFDSDDCNDPSAVALVDALTQ
ncbi:hypothetical protein EWM64_g2414 [Hericium alpestre]|uniref:DUF6697 domain-containing protein n=1 Tax=Hericium alpestre TaxID=135208 RepID=A0A4Z0A5J5_9AGAM|nr:hypothetical protein EWM64_g2414 [Hericium alpestre]